MIMVYLDFANDFMDVFYRAFLAKSIIENIDRKLNPVMIWTTDNPDIEIDAANRLILIEGQTLLRYDFLWIGNLARFLSLDVSYKYMDPDRFIKDLKQYTWEIDNQEIDLFLYPWTNWPELAEII